LESSHPGNQPPHLFLATNIDFISNRSIRVRKKQSNASSGRFTIGSFSLNEVLSTIGTPISASNARLKAWYLGFERSEKV